MGLRSIPANVAARFGGYDRARAAWGLGIIVLFGAVLLVLWQTGILDQLQRSDTLTQSIQTMGLAGPALIIGLMTIAIVMSPIPSAPIALASGAAYGHFWGAIYVMIGSVAGASIAFSVARLLGQDALSLWLGKRVNTRPFERFINSQNALTCVVFASRLLPFLSFDIVSYAAGLTALHAWRFAVATILGVLPASFLLAHFGGELGAGDLRRATVTILVLGSITLLPFAWRLAPAQWRAHFSRVIRGK